MVFSFASFLFLLPRALMKYPKTSDSGMVCCPKSGAKVGIKKKRASNIGTRSVMMVLFRDFRY